MLRYTSSDITEASLLKLHRKYKAGLQDYLPYSSSEITIDNESKDHMQFVVNVSKKDIAEYFSILAEDFEETAID